jgi:hypothetical protein
VVKAKILDAAEVRSESVQPHLPPCDRMVTGRVEALCVPPPPTHPPHVHPGVQGNRDTSIHKAPVAAATIWEQPKCLQTGGRMTELAHNDIRKHLEQLKWLNLSVCLNMNVSRDGTWSGKVISKTSGSTLPFL